jgi:hypothetical protein
MYKWYGVSIDNFINLIFALIPFFSSSLYHDA